MINVLGKVCIHDINTIPGKTQNPAPQNNHHTAPHTTAVRFHFFLLAMNMLFTPCISDRLDIVISHDQSLSIAFTRYLINKRLVWINGRYCRKPSVQVSPQDIITIIQKERNLDPAVLIDAPDIDIPVIFAHSDYLVIHKPKGVLTHPTTIKNTTNPSVTGFLYHYTRKHLPTHHHFVRSSIVHRLDRDTD